MKLSWMGEYRDMIEALIHYCNIYAAACKIEKQDYQGITYSYSQIQVLEYLLENEERRENMSEIAARLGITRSCFTKTVQKLEAKGLLEKEYMPGSRKELRLTVNETGRALYDDYSRQILQWHFTPMFRELNKVPEQYYPCIRDALLAAMNGSRFLESQEANE